MLKKNVSMNIPGALLGLGLFSSCKENIPALEQHWQQQQFLIEKMQEIELLIQSCPKIQQ